MFLSKIILFFPKKKSIFLEKIIKTAILVFDEWVNFTSTQTCTDVQYYNILYINSKAPFTHS